MDATRFEANGRYFDGGAGVIPEVAERCLNHIEENKVKRIYQRHSYEPEMREAWQRLGQRLDILVNQDENKVVTLKRA